MIILNPPIPEFSTAPWISDWMAFSQSVKTGHEYLLSKFDHYMYWRPLTDDPSVLSYRHPQNLAGYMQRSFVVFWTMWACRFGGLAIDLGSAGVKTCWTLDTDVYRGESHYDYGGACYPTLVADARNLAQFNDNFFSAVCANHMLEHMGGDVAGLLRSQWIRILRPGGILAIVVPDNRYVNVLGIDKDHKSAWSAPQFYQQIVEPLKDIIEVIEFNTFHNDFAFNFCGRKK